jgi:hypothetical protein
MFPTFARILVIAATMLWAVGCASGETVINANGVPWANEEAAYWLDANVNLMDFASQSAELTEAHNALFESPAPPSLVLVQEALWEVVFYCRIFDDIAPCNASRLVAQNALVEVIHDKGAYPPGFTALSWLQ